jgi:hypothetical protein
MSVVEMTPAMPVKLARNSMHVPLGPRELSWVAVGERRQGEGRGQSEDECSQ